jgi:hypothetical protein
MGGILGGGEVSYLYKGEYRVFLAFIVGPRTKRLVGDKEPGKREGKRAVVRKQTRPRQGIEPKS